MNAPNVYLTQDELLTLEALINNDHRVASARDGKVLRSARRALTAAIAIGPRHALKYDCVYQARGMTFPPSMTQSEIEAYAAKRSYRVDVSTDQIDVYQIRRKVATFMAGE